VARLSLIQSQRKEWQWPIIVLQKIQSRGRRIDNTLYRENGATPDKY